VSTAARFRLEPTGTVMRLCPKCAARLSPLDCRCPGCKTTFLVAGSPLRNLQSNLELKALVGGAVIGMLYGLAVAVQSARAVKTADIGIPRIQAGRNLGGWLAPVTGWAGMGAGAAWALAITLKSTLHYLTGRRPRVPSADALLKTAEALRERSRETPPGETGVVPPSTVPPAAIPREPVDPRLTNRRESGT
jgi:hypothetical protein